MRTSIYPVGARVCVVRGDFPIDAELVGRKGLVVGTDPYRPLRLRVVLDGEQREREFDESELARDTGSTAPLGGSPTNPS